MKQYFRLFALFSLCMVFLFSGCRRTEQAEYLTIGAVGAPTDLVPYGDQAEKNRIVSALIYQGLFDWDEKWKSFPLTASEVPSVENGLISNVSQEGCSVRVRISPDARWSDGVYLSHKDFIFANQFASFPNLRTASFPLSDYIGNIVSRQEYEMEMELATLDLSFISRLYPIPEHEAKEPLMKDFGKYFSRPWQNQKTANGPYKIQNVKMHRKWIREVTLVKNDEYALSDVKIGHIRVLFFREAQQLEEAVMAGEVDVACGIGFAVGEKLQESGKGRVLHTETSRLYVCVPNMKSPLGGDRNFREFLYGFSRRRVPVEYFYPGRSMAPSYLNGRHPSFLPLFYGAAAGDGESSPYYAAQGKPLTALCADEPFCQKLYESFYASLEAKGAVKGVIHVGEIDERAFKEHEGKYDYIITYIDSSLFMNPADYFTDDSRRRRYNYPGWDSEESRELCRRLSSSLEEKVRDEALKGHQRLVFDELAVIPLFFEVRSDFVSDKVEGVSPRGFGPITWNAHTWTFGKR